MTIKIWNVILDLSKPGYVYDSHNIVESIIIIVAKVTASDPIKRLAKLNKDTVACTRKSGKSI